MTKRTIAVALLAVAAVFASQACAQDTQTPPQRRPGAVRQAPGRRGAAVLETLVRDLKLEGEKQKAVEDIFKAQQQAMADWTREHGAELGNLNRQRRETLASEAENKDAVVKELTTKIDALQKAQTEVRDSLITNLAKVLTPEELAKAKEIISPRPQLDPTLLLAAINRLKIDEERQAKIKAIMAEPQAEADKVENRREKAAILGPAVAKVVETVLTEAERKQVTAMSQPSLRMLQGVDLTDEQMTKIIAIEAKYREAMQKVTTREERRTLSTEMREKINAELTQEQLEKIRSAPRPGRGARGGAGATTGGRRGGGGTGGGA